MTKTDRRNMHKIGTMRLPNNIPDKITTTPINKSGFIVGPARPWTGISSVNIINALYRKNPNGKICPMEWMTIHIPSTFDQEISGKCISVKSLILFVIGEEIILRHLD